MSAICKSYEEEIDRLEEELKFAYLAGLIDSKGVFQVLEKNEKKGVNKGLETKLVIYESSNKIFNWLKRNFKGSIKKNKNRYDQKKQVFYFLFLSNELFEVSKKTLPYLIEKKESCRLMIELRKTFKNRHKKGHQGVCQLSDDIIKERKKILKKWKKLDKVERGL